MKIIGLTGGIASGKSTVAAILRTQGVPVIDADQLARDVVKPNEPALIEIAAAFGDHILRSDGSLDRKKLASIVFSDEHARHTLNAITHPRIAKLAQSLFEKLAQDGHPCAVYEVPLLFEHALHLKLDAVILVDIPTELQIERLCTREHLSREDALARIHTQMPREQKRQLATFILDNSGPIEAIQTQIFRLWQQICPSSFK